MEDSDRLFLGYMHNKTELEMNGIRLRLQSEGPMHSTCKGSEDRLLGIYTADFRMNHAEAGILVFMSLMKMGLNTEFAGLWSS